MKVTKKVGDIPGFAILLVYGGGAAFRGIMSMVEVSGWQVFLWQSLFTFFTAAATPLVYGLLFFAVLWLNVKLVRLPRVRNTSLLAFAALSFVTCLQLSVVFPLYIASYSGRPFLDVPITALAVIQELPALYIMCVAVFFIITFLPVYEKRRQRTKSSKR